ncbi:hybrid sensor histidine kinase/response regulator [Leptolyngbya ohadii]|uniref:hybrid sensor histidine kinase/response regulator n=1 Tax=Leptolyngbya ohadii TaxID=1962290 RepID=UPI000B598599|nr:hybrid sensor histidine kinase/response regulator [Leptolyngbya ohadii]
MNPTTTTSILIVDDETDNFDVVELLLSNLPYTLHYASNGAEAIDSLDLFQPDLILLDVMMPELDGIQVCQKIKAMPKWAAIPIIMVTALNAKEDLARCLEAGADDFISKPVNRLELSARIHSMLRIKRQYDQIQSLSQFQQRTIFLLKDNLQELRGNITAKLGHELKTPLSGMLGAVNFLMHEIHQMGLESEILDELLGILHSSSCRLNKLTQRFLHYCRLEIAALDLQQVSNSGKGEDQISCSSIVAERARAIAQVMGRAEDLTCKLEEANVKVSFEHLQLLADELVENAFKFSQPNTPVILKGECQDGIFHLWICNLGRGMTDEQIARVGALMQFEREKYEQQGMGLGLEIVKKVVELWGGQLTISSIYQQEITVHVTLSIALS